MKRVILITVLCAFTATPAMAELIGTAYVQHTNVSPRVDMTIWGGSYQGIDVQTGVYLHTITDSTVTNLDEWGFCIEMQGGTSTNQLYNILTLDQAPINQGPNGDPMGGKKADYIRELWAIVDPSPTMTATEAAAMQAAIWEIVYEDRLAWGDTWDVTINDSAAAALSFKIDGNDAVEALANEWLGLLDGMGPLANLVALSNDSYQDYVVAVPLPAAVLLGVLGLGVAGAKLRKYS